MEVEDDDVDRGKDPSDNFSEYEEEMSEGGGAPVGMFMFMFVIFLFLNSFSRSCVTKVVGSFCRACVVLSDYDCGKQTCRR